MASQSKLSLIWDFLKVRKKWWLLPIVLFMLLIGTAMIAAQSSGPAAPFIYALF